MKKIVFPAVVFMLVVGLVSGENVQSSQDKGSETVIFEKGKMPQVTFPHHLHQEKLGNDCTSCHDLFPMKTGVIKQMIVEEKLKKQQVMNTKCVQCHKDRIKESLAAGPTKCTECHVRSK